MIELGEAAVPWPMVEDRHGRKVVQTARGDSGRRAYRHDGLASLQEYRRDRFVAEGG